MSTISVRLPNYLHETLRELAQEEQVSINQLIVLAIAEKVSALKAEEYLTQRADRGTRAKFEAAMAKVADVEPEEYDRL
ncbi:MAG: toxin-antitoxin system HicB family antitoxin [Anaerolineae bacterium]|nr:toxin-antitoxin system HicB family antitoxin [Anaerolineae bacterium]